MLLFSLFLSRLLCIFFLQRHKCYFAFSILAIHIGRCIALEPLYVATCPDANTNTARVQYAIGFRSENFSFVIHDWNLFGCVIIHSQAALVLARFQVFPFYILRIRFGSFFALRSFSSPFYVSIFGILIVVLYNVRVRTQQFQSIYYTHTHRFRIHPTNHRPSIYSNQPFARVFWCKIRARERERERERQQVDEECISIHLFFNRSLCTNWAKSIIEKLRSDEMLHECPLHSGRLCKYIVIVLEKPSKALADQPYRQHLVRVSNSKKNANHNVYHSRFVRLFLSFHATRLLSHMHCIYAFSVKCINGLFRW